MQLDNKTQQNFLDGLLSGNRVVCSNIVNELIENNISIINIYEKVIKKALYDIGELWEYNKISVATEHLSSAICSAILNEHYFFIVSKQKRDRKVLMACVEKEHHEIGVKMISDIFEMNGWKSYFLGAKTPTADLISLAKTISPDIIAVSLSIYFHLPELEKLIRLFRQEFSEIPILVGGQAFRHGGQDVLLKYENIIYQPDLNSTELFIKKRNNNG